ncbi:hypothetical protein FS837_009316 [Tulasnella sp. UAMH 9824]|nr:hypothetical protein FS837_009316 [Tulasnella sp. UAMH 9824]
MGSWGDHSYHPCTSCFEHVQSLTIIMTQTLVLGLCATILAALTLLLLFLSRDTVPDPRDLRTTRHAYGGVEVVRYGERFPALQEEARGLLDQEPVRGYRRLWNIMLQIDKPTPADGRILGPQDPTSVVPAPAAP